MRTLTQLRSASRLIAFLSVTLLLMPVYRFGRTDSLQRRVAALWFGAVGHIIGVQLRASGQAHPGGPKHGPALYVANHVSWLDIIVLGMKLDAVFVAKCEVADWPLLGRLARMRRCIFITRQVAQVGGEVAIIRSHLQAGRNVILFPEGTTGDGGKLLPFKSTMLAAVDGVYEVRVQPVSIAYPDMLRGGSDAALAWCGEMAMLPHLLSVLRRPNAPARLHFHPPLAAADFASRKALAEACRAHIAGGMGRLLAPAQNKEGEYEIEPSVWDGSSAGQSTAY